MTSLIKPVITEKSMLAASSGVYTFMVEPGSSKTKIKDDVQKSFGVTVIDVHTNKVHTKSKTTGRRRITTILHPRKFARVTLKKGQTIALFDLKEEGK